MAMIDEGLRSWIEYLLTRHGKVFTNQFMFHFMNEGGSDHSHALLSFCFLPKCYCIFIIVFPSLGWL